jgi:hypothetical protein
MSVSHLVRSSSCFPSAALNGWSARAGLFPLPSRLVAGTLPLHSRSHRFLVPPMNFFKNAASAVSAASKMAAGQRHHAEEGNLQDFRSPARASASDSESDSERDRRPERPIARAQGVHGPPGEDRWVGPRLSLLHVAPLVESTIAMQRAINRVRSQRVRWALSRVSCSAASFALSSLRSVRECQEDLRRPEGAADEGALPGLPARDRRAGDRARLDMHGRAHQQASG